MVSLLRIAVIDLDNVNEVHRTVSRLVTLYIGHKIDGQYKADKVENQGPFKHFTIGFFAVEMVETRPLS